MEAKKGMETGKEATRTTEDGSARVGARGVTALVAGILAVRVLGISLVLPGFRDHGLGLGASDLLVGLAFGAYGVTMALLQVPFGALSDRWGRRPVLVLGLALAAAGSVLAAWAPTGESLLVARLLQGAGAVSGVAFALLGERVPEHRRTTAVGIAGAMTGAGFVGGLVVGAVLLHVVEVPGLFLLNAALNLAALAAVLLVLDAEPPRAHVATVPEVLHATTRPRVLALDAAAFATFLAQTVVLFLYPTLATAAVGEAAGRNLFAAVVFVGGGLMFGLARNVDRAAARRREGADAPGGALSARRADRGALDRVTLAALAALPVAAAVVLLAPGLWGLVLGGVVFFAAQSTMSAAVPSLVPRAAEPARRGAVQGSVATAQYLGVAAGGALGGALIGVPAALAGVLALAALAAGAAALRTGVVAARASTAPPAHGPSGG